MEGIVAVTYRCNAHCHMCNTWQYPTQSYEEITAKDIEKIPGGLTFANVTGGEPFIREDLEDIVQVLLTKTKRLVISTNGYLTERITRLAGKFRDIGFRISLEGLPKSNDELRGLKDGFDHGLRTILKLKELGVKDLGFGITISDQNALDLMELYQLAKSMGLEFATAVVHNSYYFHKYDNIIENKELVTGQIDMLIREQLKSAKVKDWFRAYFNYGLINYINRGKRLLPCEVGTGLFFLDPFGEVRPCNGMEESMGNIKEESFETIWEGKTAEEIREKVKCCTKNCWMVGSCAPAMKKYIWYPASWIIQEKWFKKSWQDSDVN